MALEIKAIPTLQGEDAIRFREDMERADRQFAKATMRDRSRDPFVIGMHEMLKRSGFE